MIPTWLVWSPTPPECREQVSCTSPLDAARAWAERQFRKGRLARSGTDVLVRSESDPDLIRGAGLTSGPPLSATTYQMRITIVNAPAFRASLVGLAFEGSVEGANKEAGRG